MKHPHQVSLLIALDWDMTFTADGELWEGFIQMANQQGHQVYIVTSRSPKTPIEYIPEGIKGVVYCEFKSKYETMKDLGYAVHIWIDDDPAWIVKDQPS